VLAILLLAELDTFTGRFFTLQVNAFIILVPSFLVALALFGGFIVLLRTRQELLAAPFRSGGVAEQHDAAVPVIPVWFGTLLAVGMLAGLLSLATGFPLSLGGAAEQVQGRYFLNNHGQLTEVSRSTYDDHRASELRAFAGVVSIFTVIGTGGLWTASRTVPEGKRTA
jgi:ABC-type multidrug transport system fused ATPase/permease subunit